MKLKNAFKTGKSLQWAIDNMDEVEGMAEYLEDTMHYLLFDCDNCDNHDELHDLNYWMLEGCIDQNINGKLEYNPDTLQAEYVSGYYEPHAYGDTVTREGIEYRYIVSFVIL